MTENSTNAQIREEINRCAEVGRGEGMERDHLPITLPVIEKMRLAAIDNVLDVGCGSGLVKKAEEYQFSGPFVRDWDEGEPPEKAWAPPRDRKLHGDEKKELA